MKKVLVLTTSYPRRPGDVAGVFVADAVGACATGVEVSVVSLRLLPALRHRVRPPDRRQPPASARRGPCSPADPLVLCPRRPPIRARCRSRPRALAPVRAPGARDAAAVRRPALGNGRRARDGVRPLARFACCPAGTARDPPLLPRWPKAARELGAKDVRVIPSGVEYPRRRPVEQDDPPHVLYAGRLSRREGDPRARGRGRGARARRSSVKVTAARPGSAGARGS